MKINIAYIIPSLNVGGSEQKVIDLAIGLDKNKFNPIIITITKEGVLLSKAKEAHIPVFCVNKKGKLDIFVISRIAKILKQNKVDIAQVFTSTGKLWGRLGAKKAKTKVIISTEESLFRNRYIDRLLERKLAKTTSLIIANSLGTLKFAQESTKINASKYKCIYNGIYLEPFINAKKLDLILKDKDEQLIMSVARLDSRKRLDLLIRVFNDIKDDFKVKLVLVGSGPEEEKLRNLVHELKLENKVIFMGTRNDVPNLLKEADVFVLPSDQEGFGNVIIEAMASNVCVVASNAGGIPEVINHNKTGLIFEKGNFNQLKENLIKVLKDKELKESLQKEAFKGITKFSRERMVEGHVKVYEELTRRED